MEEHVTSESFSTAIGNVLYGGIDPSIPGHGGEECTKYLDRNVMILDTSIGEANFTKSLLFV